MGVSYSTNELSDDNLWESVSYLDEETGEWNKLRNIFNKNGTQFTDDDMNNIIPFIQAKKNIRDEKDKAIGWNIDTNIIKLTDINWDNTTKQYNYKCWIKTEDGSIETEKEYDGSRMHRLAINISKLENYKNGISDNTVEIS